MLSTLARLLGLRSGNSAANRSAPTAQTIETPTLITCDDPHLPESLRKRAATIAEASARIEAALERRPVAAFDRPDFARIRDRHAQEILRAYLALPEAHRAEIFRKTGKSASFIAAERLDTLICRLGAIETALAQRDIDTFAATMRFIETAYDSGDPET